MNGPEAGTLVALIYISIILLLARRMFPKARIVHRRSSLTKIPCPHLETDAVAGMPGYVMCRSCYDVLRKP